MGPPLSDLRQSVDALEAEVVRWMTTYAAWDERKHATIIQSLRDIRVHATGICGPSVVSLKILNLELDRLSKKVESEAVDERIAVLRAALARACGDFNRPDELLRPMQIRIRSR